MNSLTGMLKGAGIGKNTDDYNVFTGALYHEWTQFKEANKQKTLNYQKDLYPMATQLLLRNSPVTWNPSTWFGGRKNFEVPETDKAELNQAVQRGLLADRDPSAAEIRCAMYNELLDTQARKAKYNAEQ